MSKTKMCNKYLKETIDTYFIETKRGQRLAQKEYFFILCNDVKGHEGKHSHEPLYRQANII